MVRRILLFSTLIIVLLSGCSGGVNTMETAESANPKQETAVECYVEESITEPTAVPTIVPTTVPIEKTTMALNVNGSDLVDNTGQTIQLYGMSTHGIGWFPQYVSKETFQTLRNEWKTNCIRLALYTDENAGYCTDGNKEELRQLVKDGVKYATELGMYVIIDWHVLREETPLVHIDEALIFFEEISSLYADYDNIIYEICNEPNGSATWEDVKTYANQVIPVIRANSPDSVILVGTPTWSQDIDQALTSPLEFENIMYALHFYAATHTEYLRERMRTCIEAGLPIFVSEFGTCDASGNGAIDYGQSEEWKEIIEEYNVSFICWNIANKEESSSIIQSSCNKISDWSEEELSDQGKWIKAWFQSKPLSNVSYGGK